GDDATGGSGEGVPGPNSDLPRLFGGVHVLRRRAGVFLEQRPAQRPAAVSVVQGDCEAGEDRRWTEGVPRGDLRQLRRPGDGAIRAAERPPGLLQLVLRQGPGWNDGGDLRRRLTNCNRRYSRSADVAGLVDSRGYTAGPGSKPHQPR